MQTFGIKCLNLILMGGLILGYNSVLQSRSQQESITQLEWELEQQQLQQAQQEQLAAQQVATTEAATEVENDSPYQDGVYEGEAQGYGGTVAVQVTIENGILTDITVTAAEHEDAAYFEAASAVIAEMLDCQSVAVDTVSGATFSSNGILHAAEAALRKAETA